MNLLQLTQRQVLIISAITVIAGIAGMVSIYAYAAGSPASKHIYEANTAADTVYERPAPVNEVQAENKPADTPKPGNSNTAPVVTQKPAQAAPAQPGKAEPQGGGHIPFTNLPVTPGDPQSYIDTVGQCPFYEMAGPKGCYPPSDIVCNADWTVCEPVKALGL
jgi:hypothetical protein